jgi:hypothetical protein
MSNSGQFQKGHAPHNKGKTGLPRRNPDPPFIAETATQKQRAQTEHMKVVRGLSTMAGLAQGLDEVNAQMVIAAEGSEHELWESKARDIAKTLLKFASRLKKGAENGTPRTELKNS